MFSVQDHLHEHYCTFGQLVGKTVIEIEYAAAEQTKKMCGFVSFKTFYQQHIFTTVKRIFKNIF